MLMQATAAVTRPDLSGADKLHSALRTSIEEAATALLGMEVATRTIRPGQEIVSAGRPCPSVFLIVEGISIRYRILRDGQRQILSVVLPGDFAGVPSCFFETALYSIKTLTKTVVLPVPMAKIVSLIDSQPRPAAKLLWAFACDTAIYAERLITVGRRSATERVAHFLLELHTRLRRVGLAEQRSYRLPITQEMISDALGLSIPYVNRVLHQLRDEGLVRIKDQQVVIEDMEQLAALADFEETYLMPLSITDFAG